MNKTLPLPPTFSSPSFDQIVKGNVTIKKLSKYRYKITFSKIGKFLIYQVWDKDNVNNINDKRIVKYVSAKNWVNSFVEQNKKLKRDNKPLFTPTTIMETDNDKNFAFIIQNAYFNSCDQVVFTVSTNEISSSSTKLTRLPIGKLHNVRFDIDPLYISYAEIEARTLKGRIPSGTENYDGVTRLCWNSWQLTNYGGDPYILFAFASEKKFYTDPYMNIEINEYTLKNYGKESNEMLSIDQDVGMQYCQVCSIYAN
jgi:hypothetical protein